MKKLIIVLLFLSIVLWPEYSRALSCEEPAPPEIAYEEYDAVIIGTIEEISESTSVKTMTVRVEKSFKGVDREIITVKEDLMWGQSQLHSSLLFFLNKEGENWVHPLCSPTTANTDLADAVFADKEELVLEDAENNSINWRLFILLGAILAVSAAALQKIRR
ncbi:hypothetical protein HU147_01205 [Planomicrobium chinense]|uniref:hypothetical protein n=1 Tax=Planococcus chinensis TaxID=272917 RepID=UPI001CC64BFA|nr:hypothetical protein [Planococcus chinensis]MBZ5199819.1 hypothetical protein [Planococcus chinensis]